MASNIPRLAVTALAERLRITGFSGDPDLWADWIRNDLDQTSGVAHREALLLGDSYVIVWADQFGRPEGHRRVGETGCRADRSGHPADPRRGETVGDARPPPRPCCTCPIGSCGCGPTRPAPPPPGYDVVDEIANPLGVVPVVNLRNTDRILGLTDGCSEIDDLKPLVDALNKSLADMMVTSEYVGRPRRWATGIELTEEPVLDDDGNPVLDDDGQPVMTEVNPIPEGARAMISENDEAKFGQLQAADLAGYEASRAGHPRADHGRVNTSRALCRCLHRQPGIRGCAASRRGRLTARAEARQATFGRAWEQVARLMIAVRDGRDPNMIDDIRVQWADAATRRWPRRPTPSSSCSRPVCCPPRTRWASSATPTTRSPRSAPPAAQDTTTANVTPLAS